MIDTDKTTFAIILTVIIIALFLFSFSIGLACGMEMTRCEQKDLLKTQNELLKENIFLQKEIARLKEVAE